MSTALRTPHTLFDHPLLNALFWRHHLQLQTLNLVSSQYYLQSVIVLYMFIYLSKAKAKEVSSS